MDGQTDGLLWAAARRELARCSICLMQETVGSTFISRAAACATPPCSMRCVVAFRPSATCPSSRSERCRVAPMHLPRWDGPCLVFVSYRRRPDCRRGAVLIQHEASNFLAVSANIRTGWSSKRRGLFASGGSGLCVSKSPLPPQSASQSRE